MTGHAYLDYNASAPVRPEAAAAVAAALDAGANPSSVHGPGRAARRVIEDARERVAALVGAAPERIVFTSGGTEANNLALGGSGRSHLVVGATEHVSVLDAAAGAVIAPVDSDGVVDAGALEALLAAAPAPALVAIMLANNETGVIQPLAELARLAREQGALVHCDAVQAAGKIPLSVSALGVDLLAVSAHKLGGPQGVGALVVGERVELAPLLRGGGQERRRRAGTENVAAIAGFGVAAEMAAAELDRFAALAVLRDGLEARARARVPGTAVFGAGAPRLPNTSCLAMPGVSSETQVIALDLARVAVSSGAACSSGKVERSHVLRAMGVPEHVAAGAIRVSLGWRSEAAEVDRFLDAWVRLHERAAVASAA